MTDRMREIARELEDALESVDNAIAIRDEAAIDGLKDLDLLRAELHEITCRPQLSRTK